MDSEQLTEQLLELNLQVGDQIEFEWWTGGPVERTRHTITEDQFRWLNKATQNGIFPVKVKLSFNTEAYWLETMYSHIHSIKVISRKNKTMPKK